MVSASPHTEIDTPVKRDNLPPELPLKRTSFYTVGSSVANISAEMRADYEYLVFDYHSQNGDFSHNKTIVAIKTKSPKIPDTSLSRASGLELERVGDWVFAFEAERIHSRSKIGKVVEDVINLLEYAKSFPQNI